MYLNNFYQWTVIGCFIYITSNESITESYLGEIITIMTVLGKYQFENSQ